MIAAAPSFALPNDPRAVMTPLEFEAYYVPEPNSGCWLWTRCLNNKGYGKFGRRRGGSHTTYAAHRFSYEIHVGPVGELHVCHRCDNPGCVNPDHLFLGTRSDNMKDSSDKGRSAWPRNLPKAVEASKLIPTERRSAYVRAWKRARPETVRRGSEVVTSKLSESDIPKIRERLASGARQIDVAREFGVAKSMVWAIGARRAWGHVP